MPRDEIYSALMKPPTVFLGEMTTLEVEAFLKTHQTVIVPTGATEQHGPHLGVGMDHRKAAADDFQSGSFSHERCQAPTSKAGQRSGR